MSAAVWRGAKIIGRPGRILPPIRLSSVNEENVGTMEMGGVSQEAMNGSLIAACQRGEREAFRELFELYQHRVYSVALHYSGEPGAARDITQQVFLKLFTRIGQFRGQSEFTTWLYRLVALWCDADSGSTAAVRVAGRAARRAPESRRDRVEKLRAVGHRAVGGDRRNARGPS